MSILMGLLTAAARAGLLAVAFATAAGFLGQTWWVFDLFSHFRVQYFVFFCAAALFFAGLRQPGWISAAAVCGAVNLAFILPLYAGFPIPGGASTAYAGETSYRLLLANVLQSNQQHEPLAALIKAQQPDVIVLVEVNQAWISALEIPLAEYPYCLEALRNDHYGLAIYSRFPILESEILQLDGLAIPTLSATLDLGGSSLTVIGAHPPPPKGQYLSEQRNLQYAALARYISSRSEPALLAGDLNTSSWSPYFQDLIRESGLRDSRKGFGLQLSWPVELPILLTSIDHVLVPPQVKVLNRRVGQAVGSDHYPVILDFSFQTE